MTAKQRSAFVCVGVALALAGCALGRDEIKLETATLAATAQVPSKGRSVFVRTVTDERVFKDSENPGIPSVESGASNPDIKARAVARKRNGYGMALGDVLLEPGQTVAVKVGDALRQAFQQAGYTVVTEAGGTGATAAIIVDVRITKFWTWRKMGFTAITLMSEIQTEITMTGVKSSPGVIYVHFEDDKLVAGGADTTAETLQKALAAYRTEAVTKLAELKY